MCILASVGACLDKKFVVIARMLEVCVWKR